MAGPVTYDFVRGDDFVIPMTLTDPDNNGTPVNIAGWTIASQVRYAKKLIATLSVVITDAAQGEFSISCPATSTILWPIRELKCNIQFDRPVDGRVSSQVFIINCLEDQTYD